VPGKISGVADTMIWTCDPIPARRVLVVHRDLEAIGRFQERVMGVRIDWRPHEERLSQVHGWHVAFDDLDQKMPEVVRYLTGFEMDYGRYALFRELKIEVTDPCAYQVPDYWRDALCRRLQQ
jgi:hypothetical protein